MHGLKKILNRFSLAKKKVFSFSDRKGVAANVFYVLQISLTRWMDFSGQTNKLSVVRVFSLQSFNLENLLWTDHRQMTYLRRDRVHWHNSDDDVSTLRNRKGNRRRREWLHLKFHERRKMEKKGCYISTHTLCYSSNLQCWPIIWTILTWLWLIGPIFATTSTNTTCFKSGQKWLENNHLALPV